MAYTKTMLFEKTIEITKAYATGGGKINPEIVLKNVYAELKKLNADVEE